MKTKYKTTTENENHNIYIIKSGDLIKLGFSNNINSRLKTYIHHNPNTELIITHYVENGKVWERQFHKNHKSVIGNEWYRIEDLDWINTELIKAASIDDESRDSYKMALLYDKLNTYAADSDTDDFEPYDGISGTYIDIKEKISFISYLIHITEDSIIYRIGNKKLVKWHHGFEGVSYSRYGEKYELCLFYITEDEAVGFMTYTSNAGANSKVISKDYYKQIVKNLEELNMRCKGTKNEYEVFKYEKYDWE